MDIAAPPEVGETAVIALAELLHADLLLIDERKGVKIARSKGFRVTGTLGLLELAAQAGLVDFVEAVGRLRRTTFRSPDALLETLLKNMNGAAMAEPGLRLFRAPVFCPDADRRRRRPRLDPQ